MRYLLTALFLLTFCACNRSSSPVEPRLSTASSGVVVLPDTFAMPGLERTRGLRIYLPPGYQNSQVRYPVVYMHDGQNLFDDSTSFVGEWGVDETLDALAEESGRGLIVVGIDNGGERRMSELGPYPNKRFAPNEGAAYVDFIVEVVKPHVDANYRTLPEREHTAIFGSSMGGLISHYAILEHPEVFSRAGIFSPSYWFSEAAFRQVSDAPLPPDARLYLLVGGKEGEDMVADTERMRDSLVASGVEEGRIRLVVDQDGEHNEAFWRRYFGEALTWLFGDG